MIWSINQGKLTFKPVTDYYPNTKRGILPFASLVFHPLGVLTPKLIIQELWKLKISWEKQIPKNYGCRWILWKKEMVNISHVSLQCWS